MKVIVIGYWVWFGVSVLLLARRAVRRSSGRVARTPATEHTPTTGPMDEVAVRVVARAAQLAGPDGDPPPRLSPAHASTAPEPPAGDDDREEPAVARGPLLPPTVTLPDAGTSLAGTVFAPLPRAERSSTPGERKTLADALRGIAMPSDLAPLVHVDIADPNRRAVFATTGRAVELVGAEVAAELERLGFALEPVGPHDAIARRGDDALAVRMRTIGPEPKKGPADAAYPTAPGGSVVLDVELA